MCYGTLCLRCLVGATVRWWSERWEEEKKKRRRVGGRGPFIPQTHVPSQNEHPPTHLNSPMSHDILKVLSLNNKDDQFVKFTAS